MNRDDVIAYMAAVDAAFDAWARQLSTADVLAAQAEARRLATRVRSQIAALGHREGVAK
jgi:hypothetical protein